MLLWYPAAHTYCISCCCSEEYNHHIYLSTVLGYIIYVKINSKSL